MAGSSSRRSKRISSTPTPSVSIQACLTPDSTIPRSLDGGSLRRGERPGLEIALRSAERARDPEEERDHEDRDADRGIDQAHVAGPLDDDAAGDRADRVS